METRLLSEQISRQLLQELQTGIYAQVNRLPPEMEIAAQLNVSRTAVRDGLATLEREGFITRKHGIGTIVNRHVLAVRTRMDLEEEFLDMVRRAGYEPAIAFTETAEGPATPDIARRLQIAEGDPMIQVARLVTADGKPAIYCVDHIPKAWVRCFDYAPEELTKPIFSFLSRYCGIDVYLDLTEVSAVAATPELAARMEMAEGMPLLHMDEVGYDLRGTPVLYSDEYYAPGILHHMVLRKKI